jgi:hypothetical protein
VLRSNGAVGRRRQYGDMFGTRVVQVSSKQAASLTWDVGTTVTSASCAVLSVSTATMQARLGPLDKVRVGAPPPPPCAQLQCAVHPECGVTLRARRALPPPTAPRPAVIRLLRIRRLSFGTG